MKKYILKEQDLSINNKIKEIFGEKAGNYIITSGFDEKTLPHQILQEENLMDHFKVKESE